MESIMPQLLSISITLSLAIANVMGSPTRSPDKCVNIRLDDSQRIYLTGSGQKGSSGPRGLPGKIGPKGEQGDRGLRGIVGPKGIKGDSNGVRDLENRLAAAERLIAELVEFIHVNVTVIRCRLFTFGSCKAALDTGCLGDGVYYLQPPGVQGPFQAFCDQTTDGGGWMLQYAYKHKGGERKPVVKTLPTDPNGYSHTNLQDIGISEGWAKEVRFYCTSANNGGRLLHFKTSNANILKVAYRGGQYTTVQDWTSGTTKLAGHTAFLPDATIGIVASSNGFAGVHPFYKSGMYHWHINGYSNNRFECDDYANGYSFDTLHRVFVRD